MNDELDTSTPSKNAVAFLKPVCDVITAPGGPTMFSRSLTSTNRELSYPKR